MALKNCGRLVPVLLLLSAMVLPLSAGGGQEEEESTAAVGTGDLIEYGLLGGKPFEGATISLMLNNAAKNNALEARTGEFTELTGIRVEFDMVPFGSLLEKITSEGVGMTGTYDIVTYLDSWGPSIKQFLLPLDDLIAEAGIDMNKYPPAFQLSVTYDNMIHGFPWRGHPQLLFFREDILAQVGAGIPATWAELEEVAEKITAETDLYGMSMHFASHAGQNLFGWITYLWSNGGDIFDSSWKPIFNNAAGVEATERYTGILTKLNAAPPGSVAFNEYESVQSMVHGESAMVMSWWWQYTNLINREQADDIVADNANFAPVPIWEGKGGATYAICMPLSIMKDSENQGAAWEFLKWATNPSLEKDIVTSQDEPTQTTNVAVQSAILEDAEVNKVWNNMHKAAAKSLEVSRIMPQVAEWPEVSDILAIAINEISTEAQVKETLDKAAEEVAAVMARAGY